MVLKSLAESVLNSPVEFAQAKVPDKVSVRPSSYKIFKSSKNKNNSGEKQLKKEESAKQNFENNNLKEMPKSLKDAIFKYTGKKYGLPQDDKKKKKSSKDEKIDKRERLKALLQESNRRDTSEDDQLSQDEFKPEEEFVDAKEYLSEDESKVTEKSKKGIDVQDEDENEEDEENDVDFNLDDEDEDNEEEETNDNSESFTETSDEPNEDEELSSEEMLKLKYDLKADTLTKEILTSATENSKNADAGADAELNSNSIESSPDMIYGEPIENKFLVSQFYDLNELPNNRGSNGSKRINKSWNKLANGNNAIGLINHGVTCYMNSAVQALAHTPSVAHYLIDCFQNNQKNIKNDSVTMTLAFTFSKMFRLNSDKKVSYFDPKKLCRRLDDINCMMSEWQQEDSHEYYMSLMSRLQEDSTPKGVKLNESIIYDIFGGLLDQSVTCKSCGHISTTQQEFYDLSLGLDNRKKKTSLMLDPEQLFLLRNQIENCKSSSQDSKNKLSDLLKQKILVAQEERRSRSQTPELQQSHSQQSQQLQKSQQKQKQHNNNVEINNNNNNNSNSNNSSNDIDNNNGSSNSNGEHETRTYSIQNSIRDFFTPEIIKTDKRDQSGYLCEKCKKKTNAIKISTISRSPETLCIHLKRFRFNGQQSQKVKANVSYPEYLDLTEYTTSMKDPTKYKLTSVIIHQGRSVSSGHYIAHCRQQDGSWSTYDDEYVNNIKSSAALSDPGAYLLIYERLTFKDGSNKKRSSSVTGDENSKKRKKRRNN